MTYNESSGTLNLFPLTTVCYFYMCVSSGRWKATRCRVAVLAAGFSAFCVTRPTSSAEMTPPLHASTTSQGDHVTLPTSTLPTAVSIGYSAICDATYIPPMKRLGCDAMAYIIPVRLFLAIRPGHMTRVEV